MTKPGYVGKLTAFVIRRHAEPRRSDRCLNPGKTRPVTCPLVSSVALRALFVVAFVASFAIASRPDARHRRTLTRPVPPRAGRGRTRWVTAAATAGSHVAAAERAGCGVGMRRAGSGRGVSPRAARRGPCRGARAKRRAARFSPGARGARHDERATTAAQLCVARIRP